MVKQNVMKWIVAVLSFIMIILMTLSLFPIKASAICCCKNNFNKAAYAGKLTGNVAHDVAIIAASQDKRTGAQFGYKGIDYKAWCDEFVADCMELGGASSLSAHAGSAQDYYDTLVKKGAEKVSASKAQVGDIAFSYNGSRYGHVEIIYSISGGTILTVGGNIYGVTGYDCSTGVCYKRSKAGQKYFSLDAILHPNYESLSPQKQLSSISISTAASKTQYWRYEQPNTNGLVLKATYSDKSTKTITSGYKVTFDATEVGTRPVNISYTENGVTKTTSYNVTVVQPFYGEGTASSPYQISSAEDLFRLANVTNNPTNYNNAYGKLNYIQTNDINLESQPFTPIAKYWTGTTYDINYVFDGTYNGNYHKITNLMVNGSNPYQGLFGHVHNNGVVENLSVSGTVSGTESAVGGIAGEVVYGGIIRNCDFTGSVTANEAVGGIVGSVWGGATIESCYSNAVVSASEYRAGGILGWANIGVDENSTNAVIQNCYSCGTVNGSNSGAICGDYQTASDNASVFFVDNCYYLDTTCDGAVNNSLSGGCTALDTEALKTAAEQLGAPFVNSIEGVNDSYPVFEWQGQPYAFQGSGTESDPYLITSAEELKAMRDLVNSTYFNPIYGHAYYRQTEDITLQKNESWTPIGLGYDGIDGSGDYNYQTRMFYGVYDGNQHTIYDLTVKKNYKYAGMFGYIRGDQAVVKNLAVVGTVYTRESSEGGGCAGGITGGVHYGATIENCAFIGNVTGNSSAGGISGTIWMGGTIRNSYHIGNCNSNQNTGGISGTIRFNNLTTTEARIENCYHAGGKMNGSISGSIAGDCIPGNNGITNTIILNNCYSEDGSATLTALENATSDNTSILSTELMKGIAMDLGTPFVDNSDETLYSGYPIFEWQIPKPCKGDVNQDHTITVIDAVLLQKYLLRRETLTEEQFQLADWNEDGAVNVVDLMFLKRALITD